MASVGGELLIGPSRRLMTLSRLLSRFPSR